VPNCGADVKYSTVLKTGAASTVDIGDLGLDVFLDYSGKLNLLIDPQSSAAAGTHEISLIGVVGPVSNSIEVVFNLEVNLLPPPSSTFNVTEAQVKEIVIELPEVVSNVTEPILDEAPPSEEPVEVFERPMKLPEPKIKSVSVEGLMIVKWNMKMENPEDLELFESYAKQIDTYVDKLCEKCDDEVEKPGLEILVISGDGNTTREGDLLQLTWNFTDFNKSSEMQIQLKFKTAKQVSMVTEFPDIVRLVFWNSTLFA